MFGIFVHSSSPLPKEGIKAKLEKRKRAKKNQKWQRAREQTIKAVIQRCLRGKAREESLLR